MFANARSRSASLTSFTWSNLASALRTCEASVIGSLRDRGKAKALSGSALTCAASSRPVSPGSCGASQLEVPIDVLMCDVPVTANVDYAPRLQPAVSQRLALALKL